MLCKPTIRPALILVLSFFFGAGVLQAGDSMLFELPRTWTGKKAGDTTNNPIAPKQGITVPVWRIDRVYPDTIDAAKSYFPAPWNGDRWMYTKFTQGGGPNARLDDAGDLQMDVRGPWTGENEFKKIVALVFISPGTARYTWQGEIAVRNFEGGGDTLDFAFFHHEGVKMKELKRIKVKADPKKPVRIEGISAIVNKGDELTITPVPNQYHNGWSVTLKKVGILATPN